MRVRMTRIEICTDKFPAFGTWHEPDAPAHTPLLHCGF
jgi:hypothetical protein